jgi:hypothetical protein
MNAKEVLARFDDLALAHIVSTIISGIDKIAFGQNTLCEVRFFSERFLRQSSITYSHNPHGEEELYSICVPGLKQFLEEEMMARQLLLDGLREIRSLELPDALSFSAFVTALACHEVRHRIQRRHAEKVRLFARNDRAIGNIPLDIALITTGGSCESAEQILRDDGKDAAFIEASTGPKEMDARVIENLCLFRYRDDLSGEESELLIREIVYASL